MFHVTGTIDSVPYRVGVHDEPVEGELYGCVMGSNNATALLRLNEGDQFRETPTSDPITLSLDDPVSVLAFLREQTRVALVEGDVPPSENISGAIH